MLYKGNQKICPIIKTGITPTGTLPITQNGIVDVTNYASANVSVSGGSSFDLETIPYVLRQNGVLSKAFYYDSNEGRFYLASCDANGYIDSHDIYFEIDMLLTGYEDGIVEIIDLDFLDYMGYYDYGYHYYPVLSLDGTTVSIYNWSNSGYLFTLQADPNVTLHY